MAEAVTAVFAAKRGQGFAQHAARRSRHRHRQDPRLSRARSLVGRALGRDGVGVDLHQGAAAAARRRRGANCSPTQAERARRIVVRKGRENYLCLLNLEDAMQGAFAGRAAILAQLVGRWAAYTKDGDMVGGDLPGWLPSLFRRAGAAALTDRRGECVYAGCPHYRKCFIERAERASREADIVIANHALGDGQCRPRARGRAPGGSCSTRAIICSTPPIRPSRSRSTGQEAIELRRWIVGPEGRSRGRRRGLAARLLDVASYDEEGGRALEAAVEAARALPSDGWLQRLAEGDAVRAGRGAARRRCAARSTPGPRRRRRATGWKPNWPSPTARWSSARGRRGRSARGAAQAAGGARPAAGGGARGCARLARFGRRGRGSTARFAGSPGGARPSPRGSPCWRGSAARPIPNSSTGWRSSGSTAANMTSASTAAGSTRPSRSPARCWRPPTACW